MPGGVRPFFGGRDLPPGGLKGRDKGLGGCRAGVRARMLQRGNANAAAQWGMMHRGGACGGRTVVVHGHAGRAHQSGARPAVVLRGSYNVLRPWSWRMFDTRAGRETSMESMGYALGDEPSSGMAKFRHRLQTACQHETQWNQWVMVQGAHGTAIAIHKVRGNGSRDQRRFKWTNGW